MDPWRDIDKEKAFHEGNDCKKRSRHYEKVDAGFFARSNALAVTIALLARSRLVQNPSGLLQGHSFGI